LCRRQHQPPVETGGWNGGKSAFADWGVGIDAGARQPGQADAEAWAVAAGGR